MLNNQAATQPVHLTYFTHALREQCLSKGTVSARMRNGNWCTVEYIDNGFCTTDQKQFWRIDGNCTEGHAFDLVEFSPVKEVLDAWSPLVVDVLMQRAPMHQTALMH